MPDLIRRYGLDRWGPLTFALLILVAVIAVTVAVLIIVTRPSVDEVIRAAQAIGTAAIALGAAIAGHGFLTGHRELADATREAAAVTAQAVATAPPPAVVVTPGGQGAGVAVEDVNATRPDGEDPAALPDTSPPSAHDELVNVPRPETATRPDVVPEHHGPVAEGLPEVHE
jgi:hypothetical protein